MENKKGNMTFFNITLARVPIYIKCLFPSTEVFCKNYLTEEKGKYSVAINKEDIEYEKKISIYEAPDRYLETLALYRKIAELMIDENVLLFHCSALELDGDAYLFCGPSGAGKSTHARLWRETFIDKNVHVINDDKPLIRFENGKVYVFGTPWDGKERLSENRSAPIKGICFLNQSKINKITKITGTEALPLLMKQTYRSTDRNRLIKTIGLLNILCTRVPMYVMDCDISREAAEISYNCMIEG